MRTEPERNREGPRSSANEALRKAGNFMNQNENLSQNYRRGRQGKKIQERRKRNPTRKTKQRNRTSTKTYNSRN